MGLFNYLSDWKNSLYEKRVAEAENSGHCPDCKGKGFQIPTVHELYYSTSYECPGCNGSGTFAEWKNNSMKEE